MMRNSPENVKESLLEHHMSRVATRLMQIYDIRESSLPCLLFTDGNNLKKHLVVQLNPGEPLKSLYTNVLKPLSDQFAALSKYWALRENIPWWEGLASEATDAVLLLPVEIAKINAEIERQHQAVPEEIREAQEKLDALTEAQQKRLAARSLLTAAKAETVQKMKEELAAINRGDRQFRSLAQRTMETAMLEKRLLREQQSLAAYTNDVLDDETYSMRSQRREIEQLCDLIPDLERKRNRLLTDLTIQNKRIEDYSPDKLKKEKAAVQQMAESLEAAGYGPEILRADRASAFAAIEVMFRNGLLGFNVPNARSLGAHPMRILFLAANPTTTSHIDLEEELRSLESELRGVKYRDQVILTARHAVRPDDLVRFVRSERPTVVHFGGHGSGRGIILRNDEGGYTEVTGASLRRFFLNRGVRLVVLNACYSQEQAKLLSDSVSAVVGTTEVLKDRAAHRFTTAFYRALGEGYSIREAFRDGGDAVILDNREDVFWSNGELDQLLVTPNSN